MITYFTGGPPHLYKYLAMPREGDADGESRIRDILVGHNLFFSDPESYDDPYDRLPETPSAVLCLTKHRDSAMMWRNYADRHTGFVLRFVTRDPLIAEALPVEYSVSRPGGKDMPRKSRDWKYEDEYRIVRPGKPAASVPFNPAALTGVIFGIRMAEADKARLRRWCAEGGLNVTFYQARDDQKSFPVIVDEAG